MSAQPTPYAARGSVLLIEGYASLFGVTDQADDQVRAGAFGEALSRADIPMLLQHIPGAIVGRWTRLIEDGRGLYVRGDADRDAQIRRPIIDGASGEHWVFRAKDLSGWWGADHYPRPGGTRAATPTPWRAGMKPVRMVEIGVPAIDKGTNAPNVFYDPKSSESALPFYSNGNRDDLIQRRALSVAVSYWQAQAMVEQVLVWAWDGRPWPDFPAREQVWSDGENWQYGHWLNGRTGVVELSDLVGDVAETAGVRIETEALDGVVEGYVIDTLTSLASVLSPLSIAYQFRIRESENGLVAVHVSDHSDADLTDERLIHGDLRDTRLVLGQTPSSVTLSYISSDFFYRPAIASYRNPASDRDITMRAALPIVFSEGQAKILSEALYQGLTTVRTLELGIAAGEGGGFEVNDMIRFDERDWRIEALEDELIVRRLTLRPETRNRHRNLALEIPGVGDTAIYPADIEYAIIDVPNLLGDSATGPTIAASADPWGGPVSVKIGTTTQSLSSIATIDAPAVMGRLASRLPIGPAEDWDSETVLDVYLPNAALASAVAEDVEAGVNRLVIANAQGWELMGWTQAEQVSEDYWRLTGLLRGVSATPIVETEAGATVILVDSRLESIWLNSGQWNVPLYWQIGANDPILFIHSVE